MIIFYGPKVKFGHFKGKQKWSKKISKAKRMFKKQLHDVMQTTNNFLFFFQNIQTEADLQRLMSILLLS